MITLAEQRFMESVPSALKDIRNALKEGEGEYWKKFRNETAKDILSALLAAPDYVTADIVADAVQYTDRLIAELKK